MTGVSTPPLAKRVPVERTHHGDTVVDVYSWLADVGDPDTLAYLAAENAYTEQRTTHLAELREQIFTEIKTRTAETDLSVPSRKGEWWYYTRILEDRQYAIHCRCPAEPGDITPPSLSETAALLGEEVLLDENELVGDSDFFALGVFEVSPNGRLLAYSSDYNGDERFTLRVRDLATGVDLAEIPDTHSGAPWDGFCGVAWSADNSALFYITADKACRPYRLWRHAVDGSGDVLVYEEADERFWVEVKLTGSQRYLLVDIHSKVTSEILMIDAADPTAAPRPVWPRQQGVLYHVEHQDDRFLILHNDPERGGGPNFALAQAPVWAPDATTPLIPHRDDTRLSGVTAFAEHVLVRFRRDALTGLRVLPGSGRTKPGATEAAEGWEILFDEPLYTVDLADNPEYRTDICRFRYTSLVTPASIYDCDLRSGELTLRKREPVLGGYRSERYEQHRAWATAPDGVRVPISIVCRVGTPRDGSAPAVLSGYGSYEASREPVFSIDRLSLLDRGFVCALAHVRGGGELGRRWYEDGKLLRKKNTFTDFIACAEHLVEGGWTSADRLVGRGVSAGGLLMGAVANLAPQAFRALVAEVPFVDALTSILDPSLPLTVHEWEEWGNPLRDPEVYRYLKSYSPYENVSAGPYPAILAMTSLNDSRVGCGESAKWVAKLRAVAGLTDSLLLKTDMDAGHGGPSGRYNSWRWHAFVLAWIIDVVGAVHQPVP